MKFNVKETTEARYTVEIDAAEGEGDEAYGELSRARCVRDIADVETFLDGKGINYCTAEEERNSRVEIWRKK